MKKERLNTLKKKQQNKQKIKESSDYDDKKKLFYL